MAIEYPPPKYIAKSRQIFIVATQSVECCRVLHANSLNSRDLAAPQRRELLPAHFPGTLLQDSVYNGKSLDYHIGAFAKIVSDLWTAEIRPEEFIYSPTTTEYDVLSTYRHIPDIRGLRSLTVEASSTASTAYPARWLSAFAKHGRLYRNLKELRVGSCCGALLAPGLSSTSLLPFLENLEVLWLRHYTNINGPLLQLLTQLPALQELRLSQVCIILDERASSSDKGHWRRMFELMRNRGIARYELDRLRSEIPVNNTDHLILHLSGDEQYVRKLDDQLRQFIMGLGSWTQDLDGEWGRCHAKGLNNHNIEVVI